MTDRRIDAFFYGLFMDSDVLTKNEIGVVNPRKAYAEGFELLIGDRATLVSQPGKRSYGIVLSTTHTEISKLYSGTGLEDYRPEAVIVNLMGKQILPAMCYNLITPPHRDEANPVYAEKLRKALSKLEFPAEYIESIT